VIKWEIRVLLRHLLDHGPSTAAIARQVGENRRTINRWLVEGKVDRHVETRPGRRPARRINPTILDPLKAIIQSRLERYPELTAVRLFEDLRAAGCTSGSIPLRDYVAQVRPKPATHMLPGSHELTGGAFVFPEGDAVQVPGEPHKIAKPFQPEVGLVKGSDPRLAPVLRHDGAVEHIEHGRHDPVPEGESMHPGEGHELGSHPEDEVIQDRYDFHRPSAGRRRGGGWGIRIGPWLRLHLRLSGHGTAWGRGKEGKGKSATGSSPTGIRRGRPGRTGCR